MGQVLSLHCLCMCYSTTCNPDIIGSRAAHNPYLAAGQIPTCPCLCRNCFESSDVADDDVAAFQLPPATLCVPHWQVSPPHIPTTCVCVCLPVSIVCLSACLSAAGFPWYGGVFRTPEAGHYGADRGRGGRRCPVRVFFSSQHEAKQGDMSLQPFLRHTRC